MKVSLNIKAITPDLMRVKEIQGQTENNDCREVCAMYKHLCEQIAKGIIPDGTEKVVAKLEALYEERNER